MSTIHVADTGLFVAVGQPANRKYQALEWFARRRGVTFVLPSRVYDELTVSDLGDDPAPVDIAIEEGWVTVAEPPAYENALVSQTMDAVQRYISNADDRSAAEVERADTALAGVAAEAIDEGDALQAYVYTTDVLAGEAVESAFASRGYDDAVTYVDGFQFVDDLVSSL